MDDKALVFCEERDGSISRHFVNNRYWILSDEKLSPEWIRLKGDLHYQYGKQYKDRGQFLAARRYLKEHDIWSVFNAKEAIMMKDGYTYYKGMDFKDVSVLSFDIETTSLEYTHKDKVLLISNTFRKNGITENKLFSYDDYSTQGELIDAWCTWVREKDPSLLVGHNIYSFDLVYLSDCARENMTSLKLGRDGSDLKFDSFESKFRKDQTQFLHYHKVKVFGRELVDTYFLSIKHDIVKKKYDSYALKSIIAVEGLEEKDRVFYDASQIRFNYKDANEWAKIKQYCETDANDSLRLYDLMAPAQFYFCQSVPKSFQALIESATGAQLNAILIRSYIQEGHSIPRATEGKEFVGAISHGIPGVHRNVISFDVASLYPSCMLQYEIYPKYKDPNKNFLKMLEYFTTQRLEDKKIFEDTGNKYYEDLSNSRKIAINSAYGMMGASGLNFNDIHAAAKVTEHGREVLETAIQWATGLTYQQWRKQNVDDEETSGT